MDEEPTQQLTQQYEDPRKYGAKSTLSVQDEADVLCILLPTSGPALRTVDLVAETNPQHLLQNHWLEDIPEASHAVEDVVTTTASLEDGQIASALQMTTSKAPERSVLPPTKDIALRMSSKLHNPVMGFVFGRNVPRCDIVFPADIERMSNLHFRIFLNENGVLMLEDTSTNGTLVDRNLLMGSRTDRQGKPCDSMRMLTNGAMIEILTMTTKTEECIRFVVRVPRRNLGEKQYHQNLAAYHAYTQQARRRLEVAQAAKGTIPSVPPVSLSLVYLHSHSLTHTDAFLSTEPGAGR